MIEFLFLKFPGIISEISKKNPEISIDFQKFQRCLIQNIQKGPVPKKFKGLTQKIHTLIRKFNSSSLR